MNIYNERSKEELAENGYLAWLGYPRLSGDTLDAYAAFGAVIAAEEEAVIRTAAAELQRGLEGLTGKAVAAAGEGAVVAVGTFDHGPDLVRGLFSEEDRAAAGSEGFILRYSDSHRAIAVGANTPAGVLYGVFHLLRRASSGTLPQELNEISAPSNGMRMINHWDNFDGSVERGYAGGSFFYKDNRFRNDSERIRDYARLMASTGINAIAINNVNVHREETLFITPACLPEVANVANIFRLYGIRLFLSVNFAAPIEAGGLKTADPLDEGVAGWWKEQAAHVYAAIPDFGGFIVKADSENRPGPFTYGRDHADGANMLADALRPYGGIVIWRCFVYDCKQDWRDRKTDRARAAYDHFKPLDGRFAANVVLQIKNGPMDFQVREPVSPLFGALERTNHLIEFQIAQEYTGQQRHVCYLVPQWKEVLEFKTYAKGGDSPVKAVVDGSVWGNAISGMAAVTNVGDDLNWTGHLLAQANLYGYGRLTWDPGLSAEGIAEEWLRQTFGHDEELLSVIRRILLESWEIYESYNAPLGVGWMVNPDHHYGPNVDGYEYSKWGTYHYADCKGIGVDRTVATGTGYSSQYMGANAEIYDSLERCPDELLLFFHHVPYTHVLRTGKTVIQHIYDTHFEGAERAEGLLQSWRTLRGKMAEPLFLHTEARLAHQAEHAKEWRDMINTYFYRKSGIPDAGQRLIY